MNAPEDHLAPFEMAARIYCSRRGVDPDAAVPTPHPIIKGATVNHIAWRLEAERLLDLSMMLSAMRQASQVRAAS